MCKGIDQYKTNSIARRIVDEDNPREAQLVDDVVKEMSWNGVNRNSAMVRGPKLEENIEKNVDLTSAYLAL